MDTRTPLASRIRTARLASGLSQDALARRIEVSKNTVARWESGMQPKGEALVRLADALNVTARWLVTGKVERDRHVGTVRALERGEAT